MTEVLFYERVVPLNRETHRDLKLRAEVEGYRFARNVISVPVVGVEFPAVSREYPILFTGAGGENLPVAMVGLRPGENLYIEADNRWSESTYVPAFVRRYPFVFAKSGSDDRLTVCVDDSSVKLGSESGTPLFDESGNESQLLKQTLAFLQDFQAHIERTRKFVIRLDELGLLKTRDLQAVLQDGSRFLLRDFRVVDEEKLQGLADGDVLSFFRSGELAWIQAHLLSVSNTSRLLERLMRRRVATAN